MDKTLRYTGIATSAAAGVGGQAIIAYSGIQGAICFRQDIGLHDIFGAAWLFLLPWAVIVACQLVFVRKSGLVEGWRTVLILLALFALWLHLSAFLDTGIRLAQCDAALWKDFDEPVALAQLFLVIPAAAISVLVAIIAGFQYHLGGKYEP